jgi:hypothetical protein
MSKSIHFGQEFLSIWADSITVEKAPVTLTFVYSHLKINRGHLIVISNMKTDDQSILKKLNRQAF